MPEHWIFYLLIGAAFQAGYNFGSWRAIRWMRREYGITTLPDDA